jgi:hypothetical protein
LRVQATNSPSSFEVTTDGTGVVGHAGAALLRELADRVGLTKALGWRAAAARRHPDAAVLRDLAVVLADGGDCLSDLAALRDQPELFGPVASAPTAWRVLERVAADPYGLARLRAARAHGRVLVGAAASVVAFTPAALLAAACRASEWFPRPAHLACRAAAAPRPARVRGPGCGPAGHTVPPGPGPGRAAPAPPAPPARRSRSALEHRQERVAQAPLDPDFIASSPHGPRSLPARIGRSRLLRSWGRGG